MHRSHERATAGHKVNPVREKRQGYRCVPTTGPLMAYQFLPEIPLITAVKNERVEANYRGHIH
jgi:hypothetical protein